MVLLRDKTFCANGSLGMVCFQRHSCGWLLCAREQIFEPWQLKQNVMKSCLQIYSEEF